MDFEIPVLFNGKELNFSARLLNYGYSYKIEVDVFQTFVLFERDDEGSWRALVDSSLVDKNKQITTPLLQAIADSLDSVLS